MAKTASAEEAAAVAAAIERFVAEMAPAEPPPPSLSPWQRAALVEGVGAREAAEELRRFD